LASYRLFKHEANLRTEQRFQLRDLRRYQITRRWQRPMARAFTALP
jgi:hypothetical protein